MSLVVLQKSGSVSTDKVPSVASNYFKFLVLSGLNSQEIQKIATEKRWWEGFFDDEAHYLEFCKTLKAKKVDPIAELIHFGPNAAEGSVNVCVDQKAKICQDSLVVMDTIARCTGHLMCLRDVTTDGKFSSLTRAIGRLGYAVMFSNFIPWEVEATPRVNGHNVLKAYEKLFDSVLPDDSYGEELKTMYVEVEEEFHESLMSAIRYCGVIGLAENFLGRYEELAAKRLKGLVHTVLTCPPLQSVCEIIRNDVQCALADTLKKMKQTEIISVFNCLFSHYDDGASRILLLPLCEALNELKMVPAEYKEVVEDITDLSKLGSSNNEVVGELLYRISYPHLYYSAAMRQVATILKSPVSWDIQRAIEEYKDWSGMFKNSYKVREKLESKGDLASIAYWIHFKGHTKLGNAVVPGKSLSNLRPRTRVLMSSLLRCLPKPNCLEDITNEGDKVAEDTDVTSGGTTEASAETSFGHVSDDLARGIGSLGYSVGCWELIKWEIEKCGDPYVTKKYLKSSGEQVGLYLDVESGFRESLISVSNDVPDNCLVLYHTIADRYIQRADVRRNRKPLGAKCALKNACNCINEDISDAVKYAKGSLKDDVKIDEFVKWLFSNNVASRMLLIPLCVQFNVSDFPMSCRKIASTIATMHNSGKPSDPLKLLLHASYPELLFAGHSF